MDQWDEPARSEQSEQPDQSGQPDEPGQRDAVVAVLRRGDRVLVIERGPEAWRSGYWAPLSGKVEPGESQAEALVREVREEVGLKVSPLAKVWESETDDRQFRLHWWTADVGGAEGEGEVVMQPGEVSDARWVTVEEFLALDPTFVEDREFFERILPEI
ncbi:NUDIX hydrolase [Streptomyces sp. KM273126]|uniref:NUDIX domain-containing protein n=1 Tax=Streptomyces sp. KM273126 TaxID=2545247 RepID=UPI00103A1C52|nr:NUDIX hydrolase [Streptomyces sp. KM273126]MBA2808250.1 NUDIX hydrolase [Streptomyces sp. KM273126]